jgi:recombinational DNA repair protein (RecF pathway)
VDTEVDIAICLRQWDYSETSQTAALLSRRLGVVRVLGKGTKRADPRFSGGLEIGTLGEAVIVPKTNSGLATLAGWDLRETYRKSRSDLQGYYAVMFALEATINLLPEGEAHPGSFDALTELLADLAPGNWQTVIVQFLWKLLSDAGFRPSIDEDLSAPIVFLPSLGKLTSDSKQAPGSTKWMVLESTALALANLGQANHAQSLESEDAERVGRFLAWYVRELIERELSTLRPLFGNTRPILLPSD